MSISTCYSLLENTRRNFVKLLKETQFDEDNQFFEYTRHNILNLFDDNDAATTLADTLPSDSSCVYVYGDMGNRMKPNMTKLGYLGTLDSYTLSLILFYLSAEDSCALRGTCRAGSETFLLVGEQYWKHLCQSKFGINTLVLEQNKFYAQYLYFHSDILSAELEHIKSMRVLYESMAMFYAYQSSIGMHEGACGIYGLGSDIFWTEDRNLSLILSKIRYHALPTIIVDNEWTVHNFKKYTAAVTSRPSSFFPLSASLQLNESYSSTWDIVRSEALENTPGFIGYAVDLIKMSQEHENLNFRKTVLPLLFKNLMIFDRRESREAYERDVVTIMSTENRANYRGVALKGDIPEEELSNVYPRMRWQIPRPCYYRNYKFAAKIPSTSPRTAPDNCVYVQKVLKDLEFRTERAKHSYAIIRYTY